MRVPHHPGHTDSSFEENRDLGRDWGSAAGRSARPTHRLHDGTRIEIEGSEWRALVMVVLYFERAELMPCAKEGFTPLRNKETSVNRMHAGDDGSG